MLAWPALRAKLWAALKKDHSAIGIVTSHLKEKDEDGEKDAFTSTERALCLSLSLACSWLGVWVKHVVRRTRADLIEMPAGLAYWTDSAACAVVAGLLNACIGKSLVKMVLKKDWDQRSGLREQASKAASAWASVLSIGAAVHALGFVARSPLEVYRPLLTKWLDSAVAHLLLVEPLSICGTVTAKSFVGLA